MSDRLWALQPYLAAGVLQHGPQSLSIDVAGNEVLADLGRNGEIFFEGLSFNSPATFSSHVRRKSNCKPDDDGWASVKYKRKPLARYRDTLDPIKKPNIGDSSSTPQKITSNTSLANPSPATTIATPPEITIMDCSNELAARQPTNSAAPGDPGGAAGQDTVPQWQPGDETWVLCDRCQQWRRVKAEHVTDQMWFCHQNLDKRFAKCEVPQELSDAAIDRLLEEEHFHTYVQSSLRGPMHKCTREAFEADLIAFLQQLGESAKAEQIRCQKIQCNNRPLDVFGLYREVVKAGGLIANEAYDDTGRWVGRINFAGHVFPKMRNFTQDHRATSVGNQLLINYRKFLYDYERAWRHIDLLHASKQNTSKPIRRGTNGSGRGSTLPGAGEASHGHQPSHSTPPHQNGLCKTNHSPFSDARRQTEAEEVTTPTRVHNSNSAVRSASEGSDKRLDGSGGSNLSGSSSRRCDALLMLAGIMSDQDQAGAAGAPNRQLEPADPCRPSRGLWQTKRRKTEHVFDSDTIRTAVANNSIYGSDFGWWGEDDGPVPGDLLCARDPFKPGKLWPVLVASSQDLPEAIAGGKSNDSARSTGFPFELKDLSSCQGPALPVLVFGSNLLGWVPQALCEPFRRDIAFGAYCTVLRLPEDGLSPDDNSDSSMTCSEEHSTLSRRILKGALQYESEGLDAGKGCKMVKAVSLQYIGDRLLDLELDLPADTLGNSSFATWAEWRKRVTRAESPVVLASECLMLGCQLDPCILRNEAAEELQPTLDYLLGKRADSVLEPSSVRSVDRAVSALMESIDWRKANEATAKMDVDSNGFLHDGKDSGKGSRSILKPEARVGKKRDAPQDKSNPNQQDEDPLD